jgi:hypothetical protein
MLAPQHGEIEAQGTARTCRQQNRGALQTRANLSADFIASVVMP